MSTRRTVSRTAGPALPEQPGGALAGPWEQGFWFAVPGQVRSKSNHRRGDREDGRSTWALLDSYALTVKSAGREHRPAGWVGGEKGTPVGTRPKVVAFCFARCLLDAGNLDKSVLDALQGVVMADDAQVCWTTGAVARTGTGQGLLVGLARLAPDADLAAQAEAGAALARAVLALLRPAA